jgi:peptidoglycan L-alanyl-D-glutamate endopeptidase CwlK
VSHGLADPPAEPPVVQSLECLAPKFRAAVVAMLAHFSSLGFDPIVSESCRTDDRQAWLYGFGREWDDGRGIITQAPTGAHSWHKYGLAVDVISLAHQWDAPGTFWTTLGACARIEGLVWGGDWPRFQDRPHVQFGPPMLQAPSAHAAELFAQGGNEAVWKEVGAL